MCKTSASEMKYLEIQKIWKLLQGPGHKRRSDWILDWIQKNYFLSARRTYHILGMDLRHLEEHWSEDEASEQYKSVINNTYTV